MAYIVENTMALRGGADLISVSPPGAGELPWNTAECTHLPGVKCSGELGCKVHPQALARWHATFADNFAKLLRAAAARVRRRGFSMPEMVVMFEPQARGALHVHIATGVAERSAGHALFEALRDLAPRYGFGREVSWDPVREQGRRGGAGGYLSKLAAYVAKSAKGEGSELREVLQALPGRRVFRASHRVTARTRCTMRNLRTRRMIFRELGPCYAGRDEHGRLVGQTWPCWAVEQARERLQREAEARHAEASFLVRLELTFTRPPPPWSGKRVMVYPQQVLAAA